MHYQRWASLIFFAGPIIAYPLILSLKSADPLTQSLNKIKLPVSDEEPFRSRSFPGSGPFWLERWRFYIANIKFFIKEQMFCKVLSI
jgi:hypothetical protein